MKLQSPILGQEEDRELPGHQRRGQGFLLVLIPPRTAPGFLDLSTVTAMRTDKPGAGPLIQQALHIAQRKGTLFQLLPKSAGRDLKKWTVT